LNPRPPPYQVSSLNWNDFERYLSSVYSNRKTARERFNYAGQYAHCLLDGNFSDLEVLSDSKRGHVLKALSVLAKYLGIYQQFRQLVSDYGLKWSGKAKDKLLLQRMTKIEDPDEIYQWIKTAKQQLPQFESFMDLIAYTGMRLIEAVNSYNLIIETANQGKLNNYYDADLNVLQHYKFAELFIRKTKKCFVSFVPKPLILRIAKESKISSSNAVLKTFQRHGIKCRFGDVREAHATIMTKYLSRSEIDFLHGRIGTSVFMQHYFNPALLSDVKKRVFKAIREIQNKIS